MSERRRVEPGDGRLKRFWLFVVTGIPKEIEGEQIFEARAKEGFWGLNEDTKNARYVSRGDSVVFYSKKYFLGTAVISSDMYRISTLRHYWLEERLKHPYGIDLSEIDVWSRKLPIDQVIDRLRFIVHKDMWQIHFQGGIRELSEEDFEIIVKAHNMPLEMGKFLLIKKLSPSENREHWIRIPKNALNRFPAKDFVRIHVKNKTVDMKIDSLGRMNPRHILWSEFKSIADFDEHNDYIGFKLIQDGKIELVVIKSRS